MRKFYQHGPSTWSCEAFFAVRPAVDPEHVLGDGCRFVGGGVQVARGAKKQLGQRAGVGPRRGPAVPAVGVADGDPIVDDNLESNDDSEQHRRVVGDDEAPGVFRGDGHEVAMKGEGGNPPQICRAHWATGVQIMKNR